ncbi:unnamed protein product [Penicillium salamii]|uniref:Uncharacterized protein n=1 Tax=Penicillium salamii TaxID=1612424 RepID=A0A9W4JZA0_9EURO|nr:unnamed protein product [Penicillium salamii]
MESELRYYEVEDPYRKGYSYYKDQYLCLWEVTPDEVVGHWDWDDLIENVGWYDDEIVPALKEHTNHFLSRNKTETTLNVNKLSVSRLDHSRQPESYSNGNWSFSSEEENWHINYESDWDTDDEVEESNITDDAFKE